MEQYDEEWLRAHVHPFQLAEKFLHFDRILVEQDIQSEIWVHPVGYVVVGRVGPHYVDAFMPQWDPTIDDGYDWLTGLASLFPDRMFDPIPVDLSADRHLESRAMIGQALTVRGKPALDVLLFHLWWFNHEPYLHPSIRSLACACGLKSSAEIAPLYDSEYDGFPLSPEEWGRVDLMIFGTDVSKAETNLCLKSVELPEPPGWQIWHRWFS